MSGAFVLLRQKRIARAFAQAGATRPETAVTPEDVGETHSFLLERLAARKILVPVDGGAYWLDARAYEARRQRLRVVMILVAIVVVTVVVIVS